MFKKRKQIKPKSFWLNATLRLLVVAFVTVLYVLYMDADLLFKPVLTQTTLWVRMIFIYTFFSVLPQEFIYRVFYFKRYRFLFKNKHTFFITNALVFSIAHLMFNSPLVLLITLIGGYIFAYTYHKTKSMFWVSVEHLIYGSWLFTVGMGKMIGFPI
ncbi:membrane protease YdiL (CAAX protease family) [Wenyingzhuangia heitensis]|uniref:Membrane protease YdiL (CAAX protease family) n=1 Tax=Wenyingzhuangia heitensis TaxID=1487859 RepID=A0ABX0U5R3_9FLAO|nr:CPBP family intramembrane glutamic endopeptidase [Wenyingzhuangia heitensis]NIJ44190.1 membrane protease YdiL (CAAX protease family) [Wenyingzhuangia heitensis]